MWATVANLLIFALLLGLLVRMRARRRSFSVRVFTGLGLGILFGVLLHLIYAPGSGVLRTTIDWINLVGQGYVRLLQMVVVPSSSSPSSPPSPSWSSPSRWAR